MAKITVAGSAVVVTSAMRLEDIRTIQKYRPNALNLMGGENNRKVVFAMGVTTSGSGNITRHGASFAGETHDQQARATITLQACGAAGDIRDWVAENVGVSIISLNRLEAGLPAVLEEIAAERAEVLSNITIA